MLHGACRVLPCQVVGVCLGHQVGIVALAPVADERLIDAVHLVVLLALGQFAHHFLEDGIALGCLSERVVVDGLVVEHVVLQCLVASQVGLLVHGVEVLLGRFRAVHLHVHLEALLGDQVVVGGAVGGVQLRLADDLVGTAQQVEGLLIVVLAVVELRTLRGTLRGQGHLATVGIVVEGMYEQRTCLGNVVLRVYALSLLVQLALLDILGQGRGRAEEHAHE